MFKKIVLGLSICLTITSTVFADGLNIKRIYGSDRLETAIEIAKNYNEAQNIILVNALNFADAISASILSAKYNAPIFQITNTEKDKKVLNYINDNFSRDSRVFILGGQGAVSKNIEDKINDMGFDYVERIQGNNRYETNLLINSSLEIEYGTPVIIASGENFADALSISSVSSILNYPIILTKKNEINTQALEYIKNISPSKVFIIGGQGAVSLNVEKKIKNEVEAEVIRIEGKTRYETSKNICDYFKEHFQDTMIFASGRDFPDALSSVVLANKFKSPILLVDKESVKKYKSYVEEKGINNMIVLGGKGAVSLRVEYILKNNFTSPVEDKLNKYEKNMVDYVIPYTIKSAKVNEDTLYLSLAVNGKYTEENYRNTSRIISKAVIEQNENINKVNIEYSTGYVYSTEND